MPVILIVDDEPDIREILEIVLRDEGMEVLASASGETRLPSCGRGISMSSFRTSGCPIFPGSSFCGKRELWRPRRSSS